MAELAAKHVKMVLTGDGADELFAGYDKYVQFFHGSDWLSGPDSVFRRRYYENIVLFSDDAKKRLCTSELLGKFGDADCGDVITPLLDRVAHMDRINQALYLDMLLLLPGNNLVKPDRMTMAVSIENRAPFLDYRMMEFAFRLPGPMKLRGAESKYILKKAVTPLIGEALAYRKKQMFTVPIGEWFRDGLAELCQDLLLSSRARARGLFLPLEVEEMLRAHRAGTANFTREIRALMALEIWFRRFVD